MSLQRHVCMRQFHLQLGVCFQKVSNAVHYGAWFEDSHVDTVDDNKRLVDFYTHSLPTIALLAISK